MCEVYKVTVVKVLFFVLIILHILITFLRPHKLCKLTKLLYLYGYYSTETDLFNNICFLSNCFSSIFFF